MYTETSLPTLPLSTKADTISHSEQPGIHCPWMPPAFRTSQEVGTQSGESTSRRGDLKCLRSENRKPSDLMGTWLCSGSVPAACGIACGPHMLLISWLLIGQLRGAIPPRVCPSFAASHDSLQVVCIWTWRGGLPVAVLQSRLLRSLHCPVHSLDRRSYFDFISDPEADGSCEFEGRTV